MFDSLNSIVVFPRLIKRILAALLVFCMTVNPLIAETHTTSLRQAAFNFHKPFLVVSTQALSPRNVFIGGADPMNRSWALLKAPLMRRAAEAALSIGVHGIVWSFPLWSPHLIGPSLLHGVLWCAWVGLAFLSGAITHEAGHAWVARLTPGLSVDSKRLALHPFAHWRGKRMLFEPVAILQPAATPKWKQVLYSAAGPAVNLSMALAAFIVMLAGGPAAYGVLALVNFGIAVWQLQPIAVDHPEGPLLYDGARLWTLLGRASGTVRSGLLGRLDALFALATAPTPNLSPAVLRDRALHLEDNLPKRVVGQRQAIQEIATAVKIAGAGLNEAGKPYGSFLFIGPTGSGKTETAKALAEFLFGDEKAMVRFDMSEFSEKHTVARLIGSPPGYKESEAGGELTNAVRRRPQSVILFDEIEKAHPDARNMMLQILDDGRLTDGRGDTTDFPTPLSS